MDDNDLRLIRNSIELTHKLMQDIGLEHVQNEYDAYLEGWYALGAALHRASRKH